MKYYGRLIKGKKYKVLLAMALVGALGLFAIFISMQTLELGVAILGAFVMYVAFVYLPVASPDAQDLSEFIVDSDKDTVHIKFRKYEWHIKRELYTASSLMFFDEHHHFVSLHRAYQVYGAVYGSKQLQYRDESSNEAIRLMENAYLLSEEEKQRLVLRLKLNRNHWGMKIVSVFFIIIGISSFSMVGQVIEPTIWKIVVSLIFGTLLGVFFIYCGVAMYSASCDDKKEMKQILEAEVHKVKVYCYEKKQDSHKRTQDYYIKVSDGNNIFLTQLFEVTQKQYREAEGLSWEAYYYETPKGECAVKVLQYSGI